MGVKGFIQNISVVGRIAVPKTEFFHQSFDSCVASCEANGEYWYAASIGLIPVRPVICGTNKHKCTELNL